MLYVLFSPVQNSMDYACVCVCSLGSNITPFWINVLRLET